MILVDAKMPKRGCRDCPMDHNCDCCKITHKCVIKEYIEETFPSWCPIKAEIPDNATNGDVIKALFPNDCVKQGKKMKLVINPSEEDVTNGDVICVLFPHTKVSFNDYDDHYEVCLDGKHTQKIGINWWNAPYKAEVGLQGMKLIVF